MMDDLEKTLGKALTVKELAEYLGVSEKTVRENYQQLGGVRIGRHYRFFERRILDALEKRQEQIHSSGSEERSAQGEGISHPERGKKVGIGNAKAVRRPMERDDKHNLLD